MNANSILYQVVGTCTTSATQSILAAFSQHSQASRKTGTCGRQLIKQSIEMEPTHQNRAFVSLTGQHIVTPAYCTLSAPSLIKPRKAAAVTGRRASRSLHEPICPRIVVRQYHSLFVRLNFSTHHFTLFSLDDACLASPPSLPIIPGVILVEGFRLPPHPFLASRQAIAFHFL